MFNEIRKDLEHVSPEVRRDLFRDGIAIASHFPHAEWAQRIEKFERRRRCLELIGKIVCFLLTVVSVVLVLDWVCKKCGIKTVGEKKIDTVSEDNKELYQKLAKIKGRTAR